MPLDNLTEENLQIFAIDSYTNIHCHDLGEFHDDLLLIKYIKRLFRKYKEIGEIDNTRLRLALNHIIIFYNVFKIESATRILFLKLEPELYSILKTFLVFLNLMPSIVHGIKGHDIKSSEIKMIVEISERLKTI
jgi:hypothetical protein